MTRSTHRPRLGKAVLIVAATVAALLLSSCGATVVDHTSDAAHPVGYPVTIDNCGAQLTFDKAPTRVVTNDSGITELMFALGLERHLAGYVLYDAKDVASSPWKQAFESTTQLANGEITQEIVLQARADMVMAGWNYGYSESNGITPKSLEDKGIPAWILTESCRPGSGKERGVMPPMNALYTDLANLGTIFGVRDRADKLVASYKAEIAKARSTPLPDGAKPSVFLYDSGTTEPFTSGAFAGPHDIITKAGGSHVMADLLDSWTTTGWESVVKRNPDVIIINDYGTPSAAAKIAFLESFPPLKEVTAVKKKQFLVLPYAALVESPRNPAAVSKVHEYLASLR